MKFYNEHNKKMRDLLFDKLNHLVDKIILNGPKLEKGRARIII